MVPPSNSDLSIANKIKYIHAKDLTAEHYTAIQRIKNCLPGARRAPGDGQATSAAVGRKEICLNQAKEPSVCETKRTPSVSSPAFQMMNIQIIFFCYLALTIYKARRAEKKQKM